MKPRFSRHQSLMAAALLAPLSTTLPGLAFAQEATPGTADVERISLDEALSLARRNNRDLAQATARVAQAAEAINQAWSSVLPQVVAQGKYTHNYKEVVLSFPNPQGGMSRVVVQKGEQLDGVVNATLPVIAPAAWSALSAARLSDEASRANYAASEATVLTATAQAYYALVGMDEMLRARASAIDVAKRTLSQAQVRLEAGTATKVDVQRAQVALLRAEQTARETDAGRAQAARGLGTLIGVHKPFAVEPPTPVPAATPVTASDTLYDKSLNLRPEFRALSLSADASQAQARASAWRWAPSLSAFGTARLSNYAGFTGDKYFWAVGAQLDWALFEGGARDAQRRIALAQRRETEARLAQLKETVSDDIANGRAQVEVKRSAEETAARSVDLAKETLDLVQSQYEAGTATQLDLLAAQDQLVGAQVELAQAHVDAAVADVTLRRAAGEFPPAPARAAE